MLLRISTKMTSVAIALLGICYRTSAEPVSNCDTGCTGTRPKISNGELRDRIDDYIASPAKDVPIGCWDTSSVEDFSFAFANQHNFNEKLCWDVSSATNMYGMFYRAEAFNQPLQDWNTSSVTDMESMFNQAIAFNQPLDNWEISSVKTLYAMFFQAEAFDQCLLTWPSKVRTDTDTNDMFRGSGCTIQDTNGDTWCQSGDVCSPDLFKKSCKKSCKTSKSTKAPSSTGKKDKKGKGKGSK